MPASKPYVLGLTGGIGCGKSEASAYLRQLGAKIIDADAISRDLTRKGGLAIPAIRNRFGDKIFKSADEIDRKALAGIVFNDVEAKHDLESILHPMIFSEIQIEIEKTDPKQKVVVLDVPLLFETGMNALCDEVWTVSVPEKVQIERICFRDAAKREDAMARIANQMSTMERNARADLVIDTDRAIEDTRNELSKAYSGLICRLSKSEDK